MVMRAVAELVRAESPEEVGITTAVVAAAVAGRKAVVVEITEVAIAVLHTTTVEGRKRRTKAARR